jgi:hypothetical protein
MRGLRVVGEPTEQDEVGVEGEHPRGLDPRGVVDRRRLAAVGCGQTRGVELEPAEGVGSEALLRRLGLGADALQQMVEVERPVSCEHHDRAEAASGETVDRRTHPRLDERRLEAERARQVEAARGEVDGRQHDAAGQLRRADAERVRLERVDPEREVLAVELERPDRHVRERSALEHDAQLGRVQPLVPDLGHAAGGGSNSSSETPSWMRR